MIYLFAVTRISLHPYDVQLFQSIIRVEPFTMDHHYIIIWQK